MKTFKDFLNEALRQSHQGTLFQAIGRIENLRYVRTGSVVGNTKTGTISFTMNNGDNITINNVYYDKKTRRFYYDEILGVEDNFMRSADIINTLKEIDIEFRTDKTMNTRVANLRKQFKVKS